jgi:hypothetical protein
MSKFTIKNIKINGKDCKEINNIDFSKSNIYIARGGKGCESEFTRLLDEIIKQYYNLFDINKFSTNLKNIIDKSSDNKKENKL